MNSGTPSSDVPESRRISRDALREAERLSGTQVVVVESSSLSTMATFDIGTIPVTILPD
jgi:hypothetical protein